MKEQVDAFNQEKALVGALSVIVKLQSSRRLISSSIAEMNELRNVEECCGCSDGGAGPPPYKPARV